MLLTFISLVVDAGVVPQGSDPSPYFIAIQNGLSSALITCLLVNGFVGFQLYEDGTPLSVWLLRVCSLVAFAISFLISIATFNSWAGLSPTNTIGLFVVVYLLNAIQLFIYVAMQVFLVVRTLQDRWPMGDIIFGVFFFVVGQVLLYAFSGRICTAVSHYVDGLFFATTCNLLAVMMVYKVSSGSGGCCVNWEKGANSVLVLGLHHEGGSRVLRRNAHEQLGGQGVAARGRAARDPVRGGPLRPVERLRPPLLADAHRAAVLQQVLRWKPACECRGT